MAKPGKMRLDQLLVELGHFPTRSKAQAAVMAGKIKVEGYEQPKAGLNLRPDAKIEILADAVPFVSRGGLKLQAALDAFKPQVKDRIALDVGASTGGFTDCLLQHGAQKIYAIDVGRAQLDVKLKEDPRVISMEQTHAKTLTPETFGDGQPDLVVMDVSFISITQILETVTCCLKKPFEIIALIKPQFELEAKKVPKGVVKEESHRQEAIERVRADAKRLGLKEQGLIESPAKGPKGNLEYLIWLAS
jgi:23S rRNA (cytidine1920-2'-O)/16S rRNA (cytidine1409-2'-O)-methyltransferase